MSMFDHVRHSSLPLFLVNGDHPSTLHWIGFYERYVHDIEGGNICNVSMNIGSKVASFASLRLIGYKYFLLYIRVI